MPDMSGTAFETEGVITDPLSIEKSSTRLDITHNLGRIKEIIVRNALRINPEDIQALEKLAELGVGETPLSQGDLILRMSRMLTLVGKYTTHPSIKELMEMQGISDWARYYDAPPPGLEPNVTVVSASRSFDLRFGQPREVGVTDEISYFEGFRRGVDLDYPSLGPTWYLEMADKGAGGSGPHHIAVPVEAVERVKTNRF